MRKSTGSSFSLGSPVRSRPDVLVPLAVFASVLAAILSLVAQYYFLPLGTDAGWYSYPALSMSRGGDPGENGAPVEELRKVEGIKASFAFGDNFRRSIRIIPLSWWFAALGSSVWAAKAFGVAEWSIAMVLMFLVLRQVCRRREIALLCWSLFVTDGIAISLGSTDLRADLMLTITTLLVLLFIQAETAGKYRIAQVLCALAGVLLLALTRITSALALLVLAAYMLSEICLSWGTVSRFRKAFYGTVIALGAIGFLFRSQVMDFLAPSSYPESVYYLERYAFRTAKSMQWLALFEKEWSRWRGYFSLSNIGQLIGIMVGLGLYGLGLFRRKNNSAKQTRTPVVACFCAVSALALIDPLSWPSHAISLMPFFILLIAYQMEAISGQRLRKAALYLLIGTVFLSAAMRAAQGTRIATNGIGSGYSSTAVREAVNGAVSPSSKGYLIVGPTELWPYFESDRKVVILDARTQEALDRVAHLIERLDLIILNNDYAGYDWENYFLSRFPDIRLVPIAEIGGPGPDRHFIKIIAPRR